MTELSDEWAAEGREKSQLNLRVWLLKVSGNIITGAQTPSFR